jgi:hypothetical protein
LLKHNSHRNHQWGGEHQNDWQVNDWVGFLFIEGFSFFGRSLFYDTSANNLQSAKNTTLS